MKRRDLLLTAMAGAGVSVSGLSARDARAQENRLVPPIASFAAMTAQGMAQVRAYQGRNRREYIVMARVGGRDIWRRVRLGADAMDLLRPAVRAGQMRGEIGPSDAALGNFEIQRLARDNGFGLRLAMPGQEEIDGQGTGEPTGGGGGGGTTSALGFWGALVAIVAIFALIAIVAMLTGNTAAMKLQYRGIGVDIQVGPPSDTPPDPPGGGSFQHDPICDTMPPMNC